MRRIERIDYTSPRDGTTMNRSAVARKANVAPRPKAACDPYALHTRPKTTLATSAPAPTTQPIAITVRRPTRSDQLPAIIDVVALMTCSAAHISGMKRGVPAASVSFRRRKASVELPTVKRDRTSMKRVKDGGRPAAPDGFTLRPVGVTVRLAGVTVRLKPDTTSEGTPGCP